MGRFLLQYEDQRTPLREKKDFVASFLFVVRRTAAIIGLGCVITVVSSVAIGDELFLIPMLEMINRATDSFASALIPPSR